jgi:GT2 family glycosyltransferase
MTSSGPSLSLVIATRNRPAGISATLATVANLAARADEIIVVDQSTDEHTHGALQGAIATGTISYHRQHAVGLSRARNLGFSQATGELVGFTDDDCEVDGNFAASVRSAFARHPEVGLLFGAVVPGAHDEASGMIPHCCPDGEQVARTMLDQRMLGGMGACMVARKTCLEKLGGFDPCLGAGAKFPAADEIDLTLRALAAGIPVLETPAVEVIHRGFRTWTEIEALSDAYLRGTGAMFAKHLRLHPGQAGRLLLGIVPRWLHGRPRIVYQRSPRRLARLSAFARGLAEGMRCPVDRARGLFVAP